MYSEIWHYCAPLSALILKLAGFIIGRSFVGFQILGFIVLFLQALYFNIILNKSGAFGERTLIPAVIYVFAGSLSVELFAFSAELLALFPLLFMLDLLLEQLKSGAEDLQFYTLGTAFSISFLIDGRLFWFLPLLLIYLPFVFIMNAKRFTLFILGILFPLICTGTYYYLKGSFQEFLDYYLFEIFIPNYKNYFSIRQTVLILSIPVLLLIISAFQSFFRWRFYSNYFYTVK